MSSDDRDDITPDPDAPETEAERASAASFAKLVDGMVAGDATPPALDPDHRHLLEAATMVRAANHDADLTSTRQRNLIDRAFRDALDIAEPVPDITPDIGGDVTPMEPRQRRAVTRLVPWAVTTVAAAAALALALTRPADTSQSAQTILVAQPRLSAMHRSRPADLLIGRIDPADSGRASARIDIIFADRLAGYRDLKLRGIAPVAIKMRGAK